MVGTGHLNVPRNNVSGYSVMWIVTGTCAMFLAVYQQKGEKVFLCDWMREFCNELQHKEIFKED